MAERTVLVCDVCGALDAKTVTLKAGSRTAQKDLCAKHMAEMFNGSRRPRRGPRRAATSVRAKRARPQRAGSRRKTASKRGGSKRGEATPKRKRVTNPVTLERRRAALQKAREALAAKRAIAKKVG